MAQDTPTSIGEADQERYSMLALRLEVTLLWTELASLTEPGWGVPNGNSTRHPRRHPHLLQAYPIHRPPGGEVMCSSAARAALRNISGREAQVYTKEEIRSTMGLCVSLFESYQGEAVEA